MAIGIPIACVCIAFLIVLTTVIIPDSTYKTAEELYNAGKYSEAIELFETLGGYKESNTKIENCYIGKYGEDLWNQVKNSKVGDTFTFGVYEQDNNTSNGKEEIEWTVLDKDGLSLFLISTQVLDCQPYNTSYTDVTWESCTLRKWLNESFLNTAFSAEEQAIIQSTNVPADKNPDYYTDPGNATTDKVFLLSIKEMEKYSDIFRSMCEPTAYAVANGVWTSRHISRWWLRSTGMDQAYASYCSESGRDDPFGPVYFENWGVRPALWVNLEF